ncbi:phytoene desaturase family protein [Candidatus Uabimicrobium amorphum]|uniref:All-trans-retinol 13,14-reductase n=1 Tax=Uabimicrobium amorphum TaxID=2596890 RepID=A0A5S9IMK9_UABAM|nr:NAD(P)/FAD-dependent oxidoreductase [Candidatus Uabimicrobium amorphum]BBM84297.1 all-trans-retinol 13,14-reductase [Candidatus Uabimicrobium amorphum]
MKYDYVIVGAGLCGLTQACVYALEGAKVCIVEKQRIPGGYIQTFSRKKYRFDTGFHYVGSTAPYKPMRQFLEYLGIFSQLKIHYYDDEAFFEIATSQQKFVVPSKLQLFYEKLCHTFPEDEQALHQFFDLIKSITSSFRWYDLDINKTYERFQQLPNYSLSQWMDKNFQSAWLKEILGAFSYNIALNPQEIPIVAYAICLDSIFDHPIWLYDGGDGLITPLMEKLQELDVDIYFSTKVEKLLCNKKRVYRVITNDKEIDTDFVISTIHPKLIMPMLDDSALRPLFKNNILEMKDSRGSFGVNIILKEELNIAPLNYIYVTPNRPYSGIYINSPSLLNEQIQPEIPYRARLNVCTFVDSQEFMKFKGTKFGKRPQEYKDLKQKYADYIIEDLQQYIPDLQEKIQDIYTSSPLTNEYYTGSVNGSAFGISHDISQQTIHRPPQRSRVKNLFFSGQSINMPGICGVVVNAFATAGLIIGEDYLFHKVLQNRSVERKELILRR